MPALPIPSHEAFAWFYAEGHPAAYCYRTVGYAKSNAKYNGEKLARQPDVARRIQEFRDLKAAGFPAPQPGIPPVIRRGKGAARWELNELVTATDLEASDPRPYPAPVIPRIERTELAHQPLDFNAPSVGWVRQELFKTISEAREQGDYKHAMAGLELMLNSMMVSLGDIRKQPTHKMMHNPPVKPDADNPGEEVTVQVFSRFAQRMADATRNGADSEVTTLDIIDAVINEADGDGGPGSADGGDRGDQG